MPVSQKDVEEIYRYLVTFQKSIPEIFHEKQNIYKAIEKKAKEIEAYNVDVQRILKSTNTNVLKHGWYFLVGKKEQLDSLSLFFLKQSAICINRYARRMRLVLRQIEHNPQANDDITITHIEKKLRRRNWRAMVLHLFSKVHPGKAVIALICSQIPVGPLSLFITPFFFGPGTIITIAVVLEILKYLAVALYVGYQYMKS